MLPAVIFAVWTQNILIFAFCSQSCCPNVGQGLDRHLHPAGAHHMLLQTAFPGPYVLRMHAGSITGMAKVGTSAWMTKRDARMSWSLGSPGVALGVGDATGVAAGGGGGVGLAGEAGGGGGTGTAAEPWMVPPPAGMLPPKVCVTCVDTCVLTGLRCCHAMLAD